MTKTAVVALGGNALTLPGQAGTCEEMLARAADMAASINDIIEAGWRVVIVHGNGPQVGNLALQQEATALVPAQPLAMLGAMTQGQIGSMLALAIDRQRGPGAAASLITHVIVDPADPAFGAPTKPIGPFFERDQAQRLAAERGWTVQPDSGHGYRRVVASPQPVGIVEITAIRALVDAGVLVIAAGGGGIPLAAGPAGPAGNGPPSVGNGPPSAHDGSARVGDGSARVGDGSGGAGWSLRTALADAVIDKDRAARLLATLIGAQALLLVTAVDRVMLNYGTSRQSSLGVVTADEMARHLDEGQFPPGSMGPKIEAALEFLADGGDVAVVTSPGLLAGTLVGADPGGGTRITRSPSPVGRSQ
jgi:carbamate kinase